MKFFITLIFILTVFTLSARQSAINPKNQADVHYHAGFQVYKDNLLQDFSDLKYMHLESCSEDDVLDHPEDNQIEKAHLHNGIGDVVHVHRDQAVWGDLFKNINYPISASSAAYLNKLPVTDFLNTPIRPYDTLILFEGDNSNSESKLENLPTKEYIMSVEAQSEACGDDK